jgi:hypothetical protein
MQKNFLVAYGFLAFALFYYTPEIAFVHQNSQNFPKIGPKGGLKPS